MNASRAARAVSFPDFERPRRQSLRQFLWRSLWSFLVPPEGRRTQITPTGFVVILVCLGLGVSAYRSGANSNILFMALSLILSCFVLSGVLSALNFRGLRWKVHCPQHLRVGEPTEVFAEIGNFKRLLPTYCLGLDWIAEPGGDRGAVHLDGAVPTGGLRRAHWSHTPRSRGRGRIRLDGLHSSYPFGFLRKHVSGKTSVSVTVFPARVPYTFSPSRVRHGQHPGNFVRRPGVGEQLYQIRQYQRGDHQRLVHWKATARMRRLMVRQLMEEHQDGYAMDITADAAHFNEAATVDRLAAFAASLAEDLFDQGRLLAFAVNGDGPLPVHRRHDLVGLLEALAVLEPVAVAPVPVFGGAGANVIHFKPGSLGDVLAIIDGAPVGRTQPD